MPKVAEDAPATDTNGSTPRKAPGPRVPVTWGLNPIASLPEGSTGSQRGEIYNLMAQVEANGDLHGRAFELAVYAADERAKASASNKLSQLRKTAKDSGKPWRFVVGESQTQPGRVAIAGQYGG